MPPQKSYIGCTNSLNILSKSQLLRPNRGSISNIFTESAHWAASVSKSQCPSVCVCLFVPLLASYYSHLQRSTVQSTKIFIREKLRRDIGLRFWLQNSHTKKRHSLLMDLGHDQQQHPIVHSWGVSRGRVRGCGCLHQ